MRFKTSSKSLVVFGLLAAFSMSVASCKKDKTAADPNLPTDKLSVITPHQRYLLDEFGDKFKIYYKKKFNRNVEYEWLDLGGTSDAVKFVISEFSKKKDSIDVDIFWGGGPTPHYLFKEKKLLSRFKPSKEILKHIPATIAGIPLYDDDFYWMGSVLSSFGFACNEKLLKMKGLQAPKTWEDLGDPKMGGMFGSADPRHSGSTHTMYGIILQAYGWEKGWNVISRMGANVRQFKRHASEILKEVATGDSICGLSIDFYAFAKIDEVGKENMSFTLPENLSIINPDPIAILKGAPNRKVAEEFVSFVLSKEAQALWMLPKGAPGGPTKKALARPSIIPSLYDEMGDQSVIELNPFKLKGFIKFDKDETSDLWTIVNDMVGTLVVDPKRKLVAAQKKISEKGETPEMIQVLGSVPINRRTAFEYAKKWNDEVFRNEIINEWQVFNKEKFAKLEELTR